MALQRVYNKKDHYNQILNMKGGRTQENFRNSVSKEQAINTTEKA